LILEHPLIGVELLQRAGVNNPLWLEIVKHHHERPDGKGYPKGLVGNAVSREVRLMHHADLYISLATERPSRAAMLPRDILKKLKLAEDKEDDTIPKVADTPNVWEFIRLTNA
jgi:HD-GYP domain-containing protein (c-di-GMP phosphodiesterase class II)